MHHLRGVKLELKQFIAAVFEKREIRSCLSWTEIFSVLGDAVLF